MNTWSSAYADTYNKQVDNTTMEMAKTVPRVSWSQFSDAFTKSGVTYDQLSKLTAKPVADLHALFDVEPGY
jgi:hypothetical protein